MTDRSTSTSDHEVQKSASRDYIPIGTSGVSKSIVSQFTGKNSWLSLNQGTGNDEWEMKWEMKWKKKIFKKNYETDEMKR